MLENLSLKITSMLKMITSMLKIFKIYNCQVIISQ